MYTFKDKGDRSLTLRPEGTAGVVRSYIEHKMQEINQPVKLYYNGPMFRYERKQKVDIVNLINLVLKLLVLKTQALMLKF